MNEQIEKGKNSNGGRIRKHIANIALNAGVMRQQGKISKIDVHSNFEEYIERKAIEFENNIDRLKTEYKLDDYYDLIDKYSEIVLLEWEKNN